MKKLLKLELFFCSFGSVAAVGLIGREGEKG
jgi:hypothetical protein